MSDNNVLENDKWSPMEVRAQPFQQTSSDFSVGMGTATFTMGMIFALIPVTLATDMVYDREVSSLFFELSLLILCNVSSYLF